MPHLDIKHLVLLAVISFLCATGLFFGILVINQQFQISICHRMNVARAELTQRIKGDYRLADDVHDPGAKRLFHPVDQINCGKTITLFP